MRQPSQTRTLRSGFSLIELLVVIAIVGVLAVVSLRVVGGLMTTAREGATLTTIKQIDGLLNQRLDAIKRMNLQAATVAAVQRTGVSRRLAEVLARKDLVRQYCPQNFTEYDLTPTMTTAANHTPATESAELLYYFLTNVNAAVPGYASIGTDAFNTNAVADTDNDGLLEFVDAWRQPIRFYRWPTRLIRPTGAGGATDRATAGLLIGSLPAATTPDPLNADSGDPLGATANYVDSTAVNPLTGNTFETDYHTPNTYSTPLIVSAGEDGILGLYEPTNTAAGTEGYLGRANATLVGQGALNDNITNLNRSAGGK